MGFQISGNGQKPYTVSIAVANSPVVNNVTLGANDDQFTFSNHADTNDHFIGEFFVVLDTYSALAV